MELKKKLIKEMVEDSNCEMKTSDFFQAEKDFIVMLKEAYNVEFQSTFQKGMNYYFEGHWD